MQFIKFINSTSFMFMKSSTVIISTILLVASLLTVQNVIAQQQDLAVTNNQLIPQSSARSRGSFIKDLSGPASGKIQTLDVICGKNSMTVRAEFSGPFYGIVFSKGTYGQDNCIYVKQNSGLTHAAFNVYYDQCGTKPDLQGKFYENTIVIQYGSDIIEAYDEAKRLRCEWFEAYEKPATFKPAIPVADLEVVEMNFQGDDIDCWMEIQEGTGPQSREVSKIVPVGQPMTIVVAINDYNGQFDMRVKSCVAHDGVQQPITLTDEFGCVLRPKMLTPFTKVRNPGGNKKATILSYSRFLAFKFPDSMTVQIQCTVEVCRHGCADACQRVPSIAATTMQPELSLSAKWPAAPNQAAISGPSSVIRRPEEVQGGDESQYNRPTRVQFAGRQEVQAAPEMVESQQYGARPQNYNPSSPPSRQHNSDDDMSGSESNHQPQVTSQAATPTQQPVHSSGHRRHESNRLNPMDGSVPQYLVPINSRRVSFNNRPSVSSTQATAAPTVVVPTTMSTSTPTTMSSATEPSNKRSDNEDSQPDASSNDDSLTRLTSSNQPNRDQDQDQYQEQSGNANSADSQADNKADSSQMKPVVASVSDEVQQAQAQVQANSENATQSQPSVGSMDSNKQDNDQVAEIVAENKPSVQADEVNADNKQSDQPTDQLLASASSPVGQSSSLRPVEVEIPANEDPIRTLISSSQPSSSSDVLTGPFQSTRLSNIELGQNGGYDAIFDSNNKQSSGNSGDGTQFSSPEQVIQPRETPLMASADKRERNEENNFDASANFMTGKAKFGARSQPSSSLQPGNEAESRPPNHQMASADQSDTNSVLMNREGVSGSAATDNEKVISDRSDDSTSNDANKDEGSSLAAEESSLVGSKIKPVVGTDELAPGPSHLEDRIGSPAQQESLEEAINRLQHQIPQTAALVGENKSPEQLNGKPEQRTDASQVSVAKKAEEQIATADSRLDVAHKEQKAQSSSKPQQQYRGQQKQELEPNQPFPNVQGQAKVLPDPSSNLNVRNSLMAQSSNQDAVIQAVLPAKQPLQPQQQQQQQQQQQLHQQPIDPSKPVAQITNIPMNIGFAQNQIPAIQQLSQQLAYFQQQQQQQIKQQPQPQPTSKPTRSRFNILSPQAALHAVASRLLPKSMQHQTAQQGPQYSQPQMLAHNLNKLTPEQQQKFFAQNQQQAQFNRQQAQYMPNRLMSSQQQAPINTVNRPTSVVNGPQQQQQQQQHQAQANVMQQPLVRSRRSAIMPNGERGNGEVGMTKTFMVVTGVDLAFSPNLTDNELPQILEGRRPVEDDVIYGICMPVVSLTFVLTCAFWLIVFILSFCIYMLIKSRRLQNNVSATKTEFN